MSRSRRPVGNGRSTARPTRNTNSRDFWGASSVDPEPADSVTMAEDATAMVRSLGTPPLAGQDAVAEHYFTAVYVKAAALASALAAADGLLETKVGQ